MKRAYQYIRISEEDQSNWSISGQQDMNQRFAEKNGIQITRTFIDEGRSARDFNRPAWKDLLATLKKEWRKVDFILVNRYNRFARNAGEGILLIEQMEQRYHIRVVSVMENISIDPHSPFFFKMRADMLVTAEFERRVISDQSKAGMWRAKGEGRYIGRAPFGYKNARDERNKPIIVKDESKAAVFQAVEYYFFQQDLPWATVQEKVRAAGFNRSGNGAVKRFILNPVYYGIIDVPAYKSYPAFTRDGIHEGWFPKYYHEIARERLDTEYRQRLTYNDDVPLRGFICCPECGNLLTGGPSKGRNDIYMYYRCNKCTVNYSAKKAHAEMEEILRQLSFRKTHLSVLRQYIEEEIRLQTEARKADIPKLQKTIAELEQKLHAVEDKYFAGKVDDLTFKRWGKTYRRDLAGKVQELRNLEESDEHILQRFNRQLPKLQDLRYIYNACNEVSDKQLFLKLLFGSQCTLKRPGYRTAYINPLFFHNIGEISLLEVQMERGTPPENGAPLTSTPIEILIKPIQELTDFLRKIAS